MFLNHFIVKPRQVGAFCASSPALASAMMEKIAWEKAQSIIEIGPGTGAFTGEILKNKQKNAHLVAVEINPKMAEVLRQKFPQVTVEEDDAQNLSSICAKYRLGKADAIISGIPWTMLPVEVQDSLLAAIAENLAENGRFATFMYALPTRRKKNFVHKLARSFGHIELSKVVWRNVPPAFVCYCQKRK